MLESTYAKALTQALDKGEDSSRLIDGLVAHLQRTGRLKLLPRIKKELERSYSRARKNDTILEVAQPEDVEEAVRAVTPFGIVAPNITINDSLIRGWRVRNKGTLVDYSAKNTLLELYRRITN